MSRPQREIFGRRRIFAGSDNNQSGKSRVRILGLIAVGLFAATIVYDARFGENSSPTAAAGTSAQPPAAPAAPGWTPTAQSDYGHRSTDNGWPTIEGNNGGSPEPDVSNYYIILDGSGSMSDVKCSGNNNKMTVASRAVWQFATSIDKRHYTGLYVFDNRGRNERAPLAPDNSPAIRKALSDVTAGGATPLRNALSAGVHALRRRAEQQLGYGEYHLVVVTDGEASQNQDPRPIVDELLKDTPIVLHTIGFCIDGAHSLNRDGVTLYQSANDGESLSAALDDVLAESPDFSVSSFTDG